MQQWTFQRVTGGTVTVTAATEEEARHLAMVEIHGPSPQFCQRAVVTFMGEKKPPSQISGAKWAGKGLWLISPR